MDALHACRSICRSLVMRTAASGRVPSVTDYHAAVARYWQSVLQQVLAIPDAWGEACLTGGSGRSHDAVRGRGLLVGV